MPKGNEMGERQLAVVFSPRRRFPLSARCARVGLVVAGCLACNGNSTTPTLSDSAGCGRGAITNPVASCSVTPHCPAPRPPGSRTLVAVFACAIPAGGSPCAIPALICPLLDPGGLEFTTLVSSPDTSVCQSTARIAIRPINGGGVQVEWIAQEMIRDNMTCQTAGPETKGTAAVNGPCCATTFDIAFPLEQRTLRVTVQTDWQP